MQRISANKNQLSLALIAVLFTCVHPALADIINVTSSAVSTTVLAPSSDSVSLDAGSGTFDSTSGTFLFQTGDFIIGNSNIPDQVIPFSFQDSITLNGITQEVTISGQDSVTSTSDDLTIFGGTPVMFGNEIFTLQSFDVSGYNLGDDLPIDLEANVTPEPGTFLLRGTGLFGVAAMIVKKRFVFSSAEK